MPTSSPETVEDFLEKFSINIGVVLSADEFRRQTRARALVFVRPTDCIDEDVRVNEFQATSQSPLHAHRLSLASHPPSRHRCHPKSVRRSISPLPAVPRPYNDAPRTSPPLHAQQRPRFFPRHGRALRVSDIPSAQKGLQPASTSFNLRMPTDIILHRVATGYHLGQWPKRCTASSPYS